MHSLSEIEEIADAPRRTITFWTEQGVLIPAEGTNRAGRGVHRQFPADEAIIACVMRAISQDHGVPIGRLLSVSRMMRLQLRVEGGAARRSINQAISGAISLFLILEPGDGNIGFFPISPDEKAEKNFYNFVVKQLILQNDAKNCMKIVVFLNPWLSRVRESLKE